MIEIQDQIFLGYLTYLYESEKDVEKRDQKALKAVQDWYTMKDFDGGRK